MALTPGYTDLATAKLYLDKTKSGDDPFINQLLCSAERVVEMYTRRQFHPEPALVGGEDTAPAVTKTFSTHLRSRTRIRDLREADSVRIAGLTLDINQAQFDLGDTQYEPATSITMRLLGFPFTWGIGMPGVNDLVITGRWGWNPPPPDILDATYVLCARMFKERDANYSDSLMVVEGVIARYTRQLPGRVQQTLDNWRVPSLALV